MPWWGWALIGFGLLLTLASFLFWYWDTQMPHDPYD